MEDNLYYGTNVLTGEKIFLDRKKENLNRAEIIGKPGMGVHVVAKNEIIQIISKTDDAIIYLGSDKDCWFEENGFIVKPVGSQCVFNPLDISLDLDKEKEAELNCNCYKAKNMATALYQYVTENAVDNSEKYILQRATHDIIMPFIQEMFNKGISYDPKNNPTFMDIIELAKGKLATKEFKKDPDIDWFFHKTVLEDESDKMYLYPESGMMFGSTSATMMLSYAIRKARENYKKGKCTWIYIEDFDGFYYCAPCLHMSAYIDPILACCVPGTFSTYIREKLPKRTRADILYIIPQALDYEVGSLMEPEFLTNRLLKSLKEHPGRGILKDGYKESILIAP